MMQNKTVLTGIKPTGVPHLGNLVGAINPLIDLAAQAGRSYVFIADLHALNSVNDSERILASIGWTKAAIARRYEISRQTVHNVLKNNEAGIFLKSS